MKRRYILSGVLAAMLAAAAPTIEAFDLQTLVGSLGKAYQAYNISDGEVRQYVTEAITKMDGDNKVLPESSPYTKRLRRVTSGLTAIDGVPLNFKVYKTDQVNAFACADGSVRVYTGLMDLMDDNELLGVIGHELGHVALHHSRNAMRNALLTSAGREALGSMGGAMQRLTQSQLGALGETMITSSYSRKQESEADDYGYDFLRACGKNPWAMALAFNKLAAMEKQGDAVSGLFTRIFSDHPDTASRIRHMSDRAKADGYQLPQTGAKAGSSTIGKRTKRGADNSRIRQSNATKSGYHTEAVSSGSIGSATQRALKRSR